MANNLQIYPNFINYHCYFSIEITGYGEDDYDYESFLLFFFSSLSAAILVADLFLLYGSFIIMIFAIIVVIISGVVYLIQDNIYKDNFTNLYLNLFYIWQVVDV
jgi:hypothetical protein